MEAAEEFCQGVTVKKTPCTRRAKVGGYCAQHAKKEGLMRDVKETTERSAAVATKKSSGEPVWTITFGDVAENSSSHGNQKLGKMSNSGFTMGDLKAAQRFFEEQGVQCELHNLVLMLPDDDKILNSAGEAGLLVIKQGAAALMKMADMTLEQLFEEQKAVKYDSKYKNRGKVVNKQARHNICFADKPQEPDYEDGKGTVVAFADVPCLNAVRKLLSDIIPEADNLLAEGNHYFDTTKCGIGFHGDAERRKVIAIRLGGTMPLHFQWFHDRKPVGERLNLSLEGGDMYIMSAKAVGTDWKKVKIPTLRHAAGCDKYTTIKEKKPKKKAVASSDDEANEQPAGDDADQMEDEY